MNGEYCLFALHTFSLALSDGQKRWEQSQRELSREKVRNNLYAAGACVRVLLLPFSVPFSACALRCQWRFIQPIQWLRSPTPIGHRNFENAKSNYGYPRSRSHILRKFINKHENAWNVHPDYVSRWKLFRRPSRHNKANKKRSRTPTSTPICLLWARNAAGVALNLVKINTDVTGFGSATAHFPPRILVSLSSLGESMHLNGTERLFSFNYVEQS